MPADDLVQQQYDAAQGHACHTRWTTCGQLKRALPVATKPVHRMTLSSAATCMVTQACQQYGANLGDKLPSLGPADSVLVHEHPHQLWNAYGGVSVIQLERHLLRECIQGPMSLLEAPYHILHNKPACHFRLEELHEQMEHQGIRYGYALLG